MITDPQNVFEQVQNEIATKLATLALFTGIKMPDGRDFEILTEDEGDPEFLFTGMIDRCGLSIIVQSPTGKIIRREGLFFWFDPFMIAVSISEAVVFNRTDQGTQVRLMRATWAVLAALHGFAPPSLGEQLFPTRLLKDKDTKPGTEDLVASRILVFEATEVALNLSST